MKPKESQQGRTTQDKPLLPMVAHPALKRSPSHLSQRMQDRVWHLQGPQLTQGEGAGAPCAPGSPTATALYSTGARTTECRAESGEIPSAVAQELRALQPLTARGDNRQVSSTGVTLLYLSQGFLKQTKGAFVQVGRTCCSIISINRKCQTVFAEVFYCSVLFCFLIFIIYFTEITGLVF